MRLSAPAPRELLHTRRIVCEGFKRADGDWDIEARMIDTKAFAYDEPVRGHRELGSHVHNMAVRLTVDSARVIKQIEVEMAASPYPGCPGAVPAYQGLVGKQIGKHWRQAVNVVVGGNLGCTHARELLFPMATVAYQTLNDWNPPETEMSRDAGGKPEPPYFIDGCKAWAADGEMVARFYPRYAIKQA